MSLFSKQIDKRIAAYQRELIETHYREVDNMYRQIRGWRHDYRNHIQTMKVLAANGDMDAIKAYLDELDTDRHSDLSRLGLWAIRLYFTTENAREVDLVLSGINNPPPFDPGANTRGLYLRGLE